MSQIPKLAIVYLSYHSEEYLSEMVEAISKTSYPKDQLALVIVDNPHKEFGNSLKAIKEIVEDRDKNDLPKVIVLPQTENTGFCGGNNVGIQWAIDNNFDYVFLHNQDGYVAPDAFSNLVEVMENDKKIGCSQSLVILHGTNKINTVGNSFNYLGFGFIDNFGVDVGSLQNTEVRKIGYASGAALMMRVDLLKKFGALDKDLFAYHEDIEYSLRLRMAGYSVVAVPKSVFYHKYIFNRNSSKFYFMERNRYALLLMYYKWLTLVLLFPMIVVMELGLLLFFVKNGWFEEKLKMYKYWFNKSTFLIWLNKRKDVQKIRVISDREFLHFTSKKVYFGEKKEMNNPFLIYFANPLMVIYGTIARMLILW